MEQSGSNQVDNNKKVIISIYKGRKVVMTTVSAKLIDRKLLIVLAKKALKKNIRDINV